MRQSLDQTLPYVEAQPPVPAARVILSTLRADFFPGSIIPVVLGSLLALRATGSWHWGLFGWTLAGAVLMHAAANVSNDYFDYRSGNDAANRTFIRPFTGGSRTVLQGLITPRGLALLAATCFLGFLVVAAYLTWRVGPQILWLGAVGAATGILYTAPPVRLVARGLGEPVVALDFAVLPTLGAYFVQTGTWSWLPVWASLPVAILILAVLFVNQFPDYEADKSVGKNNWVVRLGRPRAAVLDGWLMAAWPVALILAVTVGGAPKVLLVGLTGIPVAFLAARALLRNYEAPDKLKPACALTVALHAGVGILMCAALLVR